MSKECATHKCGNSVMTIFAIVSAKVMRRVSSDNHSVIQRFPFHSHGPVCGVRYRRRIYVVDDDGCFCINNYVQFVATS